MNVGIFVGNCSCCWSEEQMNWGDLVRGPCLLSFSVCQSQRATENVSVVSLDVSPWALGCWLAGLWKVSADGYGDLQGGCRPCSGLRDWRHEGLVVEMVPMWRWGPKRRSPMGTGPCQAVRGACGDAEGKGSWGGSGVYWELLCSCRRASMTGIAGDDLVVGLSLCSSPPPWLKLNGLLAVCH